MASRRVLITMLRTSPDMAALSPRKLSQRGITIWFDTMVDSAMAATITIEVADENPPRNDSIAKPSRPSLSGTVRTNRSGLEPTGSNSNPITAMGTTNRLIAARYRGNAHPATRRWRSSSFSTTITWNMRGRQINAAAARNMIVAQRDLSVCQCPISDASIRSSISGTPSAMPQTTKIPTANNATSLTTASSATAVTTPWWRSLASRFLVPNRIAKAASPVAAQNAVVK